MLSVLLEHLAEFPDNFWNPKAGRDAWELLRNRALHTVPVEERHIDLAEARHTGQRAEVAGPSLAVEERRIGSALEVVVRSPGAGVL
jgi:hypothetical protein